MSSSAQTSLPSFFLRLLAALSRPLKRVLYFSLRPWRIFKDYRLSDLRPDLVAGMTVAVVMLPGAMAYALIAELPPQMGLYAAIVGSIAGALWGSSNHLQTGPTNPSAMLVLVTLLAVAVPGTPEYLLAAGMVAFLAGLFRLVMGVARLGMLVSFVSDAVVTGFTAGVGVLIFINQLRNLLRLNVPSDPLLWETLRRTIEESSQTHFISLAVGAGTIAIILVLRRVSHRIPGTLIAMIAAAVAVWALRLDGAGVRTIGALPRSLPPFVPLPIFDLRLMGQLATGALALAAIGLVEATAIARSLAAQSGQRLDSNQEFFGQGMANIVCGLFSGYSISGSFTRSAVNQQSGARTPLASAFAGVFVLLIMLAAAPLAAYVPLPALAGVIILVAVRLVDVQEIRRIWGSPNSDRAIMLMTLLASLFLQLQFAVLSGILISLVVYLIKTSTPRVRTVLPDAEFTHFRPQPEQPQCPQLGVIEILGDLYFGAAGHVEEAIHYNLEQNPGQRFLLLRMHSVEHCDISGIHALEHIAQNYRQRGGDLFLVRVRLPVLDIMQSSGFISFLGIENFLEGDDAIGHLYRRMLDPAVCVYECPLRAFEECQDLPKRLDLSVAPPHTGIVQYEIPVIEPVPLWGALHDAQPPLVFDVRELREYQGGHIPGARSLPLPALLADLSSMPLDVPVVLVCRGGRRSTRAAAALYEQGCRNVSVLRGGMLAWEAHNLFEAYE